MTDWSPFHRELEAWARAGLQARLWLRDDDVTDATPALDRFLALGARHAIPIVFAAVPLGVKERLAVALCDCPHVTVAQHGYAHVNHAPAGAKKCELGDDRPLIAVLSELAWGRDRLNAVFGHQAIPLLVPPWNRISDAVAHAAVPSVGTAISSYRGALVESGLPVVNTHVDIMNWQTRTGHEPQVLVAELCDALRQQRTGKGGPVGILTHHLVHDQTADRFLADLFVEARDVHWLDGRAVIATA